MSQASAIPLKPHYIILASQADIGIRHDLCICASFQWVSVPKVFDVYSARV